MKIIEAKKGNQAIALFDDLSVCDKINKNTKEYFERRAATKQEAKIKIPEIGSVEFKDANELILMQVFKEMFKQGKISTVWDYANFLDNEGYEKPFQYVVKHGHDFEKMLAYC